MSSADDDDFNPDLLADGESMHVPMRFCDAAQRDLAAARAKASPRVLRDSAAYPRPRRGVFAVDAYGGTEGLHRPGVRYAAASNHVADHWLADSERDEIQRAHDAYRRYISNLWRDQDNGDDDDDDHEVEGRRSAIHSALLEAGGSPNDVREYTENLDPEEVAAGSIGHHVRVFQQSHSNSSQEDAARRLIRDRQRLEQLYRQRDFELSQQWRHGK
jgi:hypothetical protein